VSGVRCAGLPAPYDACRQPVCRVVIVSSDHLPRVGAHRRPECRHILLQDPQHHERAVYDPFGRGRQWCKGRCDILSVLSGVPDEDLARPQQHLPGPTKASCQRRRWSDDALSQIILRRRF